jgi:hypothetical protein
MVVPKYANSITWHGLIRVEAFRDHEFLYRHKYSIAITETNQKIIKIRAIVSPEITLPPANPQV